MRLSSSLICNRSTGDISPLPALFTGLIDAQERDRLLAQSEEATRTRLKQQEVKQKEAAVKALLQQYSSRLCKLLGTDSAGVHVCTKIGMSQCNVATPAASCRCIPMTHPPIAGSCQIGIDINIRHIWQQILETNFIVQAVHSALCCSHTSMASD